MTPKKNISDQLENIIEMILERYNGFIQAFLFLFVLLYDGIYKGVLNNAEETSLLIDIAYRGFYSKYKRQHCSTEIK